MQKRLSFIITLINSIVASSISTFAQTPPQPTTPPSAAVPVESPIDTTPPSTPSPPTPSTEPQPAESSSAKPVLQPRTQTLPPLEEETTARKPDATVEWYKPTIYDKQIPWNTHNAWGIWTQAEAPSSFEGAFYYDFNSLHVASFKGGSAHEISARIYAGQAGLVLGGLFMDVELSDPIPMKASKSFGLVGFDFLRKLSWYPEVWDFPKQDIQIGLAIFAFDIKLLFGEYFGAHINASLPGFRATFADLLKVELRPTIGYLIVADNPSKGPIQKPAASGYGYTSVEGADTIQGMTVGVGVDVGILF